MHLLPATYATDSHNSARVAVLPVGSYEQHGDHLPLATDTIVASLVAERIATDHGLRLLAPLTYSCSHEHEAFPGTVSISATTLIAVLNDIRASLARSGIDKLVIVNGHGGNYVLSNIVQEANTTARTTLLFPSNADWTTARRHAELTSTSHDDMHGGELETSLLLHAHPELVRGSYRDADHHAPDRPHLLLAGMSAYTDTGIIGYPSRATAAKGKAVLESLAVTFAGHLPQLLG